MTKKEHVIKVEPLRTKKEIEEMQFAIKRGNKGTKKRKELAERDWLLFLIGINTGLRVNDIVRLKVKDVRNKDSLIIQEGKTGKKRDINIGMIQDEIDQYIADKSDNDYLFQSQRGTSHITTTQAYRVLDAAADFIGRNDIGTHTMRKTFGYHHYKQFKDIAMLQEIFNHDSPSITRRYIGITQDEINESLNHFRIG